jgi:uncharacterized protein (TIGR03118 family)
MNIQSHQLNCLAFSTLIALLGWTASVRADHGKSQKQNSFNHYQQINLVSDQPGVALLQDTDLVNAWGISAGPTTPFWISDNGTGRSTLYAVTYDAQGHVSVTKPALFVTIPGEGNPTGQLFNNTSAFNGDIFIFVSEDGTISGWRPALGTSPGTSAETLATKDGAVYKGVTLVTTSSGPMLLAANFSEGTIDAYDSSMTLTQYKDMRAPAGYAPFNVQILGGVVFVTFAKRDGEDDVPGPGNGLIDLFNPENGKFMRFATGSQAGGHLREINSPWGLAIAPSTFGKHAGQLLVGNFGSGTIMSFELPTGEFKGQLKGTGEGAAVIDGLWALRFGNAGNNGRPSTLYFTAGPEGERHGLFGSLDPVKGDGDDDDDD